jgi:hypothetical protein
MTEAFDYFARSLMFCLPGHIVTFDPETQLAQVQCGIQKILTDSGEGVAIPVIENVPVQFAGNDNWYLWHEITSGCQGVIVFSQRAMDLWVNEGGVIKPHDARMFSASDAMFIPGVRAKTGAIPNFKNEGIGLSDYAGANYVHLKDGAIDVVTTTLNITANINHIGDTTYTGDTEFIGELKNNGKAVGSTHKHSGVQPGGGQTGVPV